MDYQRRLLNRDIMPLAPCKLLCCSCSCLPLHMSSLLSRITCVSMKSTVSSCSFLFLQILPNQLNLVRNIRSIVVEPVWMLHLTCHVNRHYYCPVCTAFTLQTCVHVVLVWLSHDIVVYILPVLYRVLW